MKLLKRFLCVILTLTFVVSLWVFPADAAAKTIVEQRLVQVQKLYPQDSTFDEWVSVPGASYGGCNGLVAFATGKIFYNYL